MVEFGRKVAFVDNALVRKFERLSPLSLEDKALLTLATEKPYTVGPRQDIIAEGQGAGQRAPHRLGHGLPSEGHRDR